MGFSKKGGRLERRQPRISTDSARAGNVVFSYHARPAMPNEQRPVKASAALGRIKDSRKQIKRLQWRHLPSVIAMLGILASIVYVSTLTMNPRLVLLGQGDSTILLRDKQQYAAAAQQILQGSLLNRSKITIDSEGFSKQMKQRFPELSEVAITSPLMGRRPVVEVVAAQPVLRITSQGETYLLDETGRALIRQKDAAAIAQTKLFEVKDQSNIGVSLGKGVLPKDSVAFITTFTKYVSSAGLTPIEIVLPTRASEVQLRFKEVSYYVKASVMSDPRLAAGQFLATKNRLIKDGTKPTEYIDIRVEEKVYVK